MCVKILVAIVLVSYVNCDPRRVPKIYNAVITSSDNLEPSKAYPIIQPVIQPAAIAYQVHLPYIPNGAYPNYIQQHIHPDVHTYHNGHEHIHFGHQSNSETHLQSEVYNPHQIQTIPQQSGNVLTGESSKRLQEDNVQLPTFNTNTAAAANEQYVPNLEQPQYQPNQVAQPHVVEAKPVLPSRINVAPVQNVPNYQPPPSLNAAPQAARNIAPNVASENVNQASSSTIGGMPQYGDILNNHFRHKYPDIPDVPPPPLPTTRKRMQEVQPQHV